MSVNTEIYEKLVSTIEGFLQVAREKNSSEKLSISPDTDIYEDLEIDSLEAMDLIAEIENEFGISADAQELMTRNKVKGIVEYIESKMN